MSILGNLENLNVSEACFNEILETIKKYINENIFGCNDGRGDLLHDIDKGLGSPVEKRWNKFVSNVTKTKEPSIRPARTTTGEIKNKQINQSIHKDKSVGSTPTLKNAYKSAETIRG